MEHLGFFLVFGFLLAIIATLTFFLIRYFKAYNFVVSLSPSKMELFFRGIRKISMAIIKAREYEIRKHFEHIIDLSLKGDNYATLIGLYLNSIEGLPIKKRNFLMKIFREVTTTFPVNYIGDFTAEVLKLSLTDQNNIYSYQKAIEFMISIMKMSSVKEIYSLTLAPKKRVYMESDKLDSDTKTLLMSKFIELERRLK